MAHQPKAHQPERMSRWRRRAYEILEHGPVGDRRERVVSRLLILLVLVNVAAVVLESVPCYEAAYKGVFIAIEMVSIVGRRSTCRTAR
jgi:voltage-gated potassium channel